MKNSFFIVFLFAIGVMVGVYFPEKLIFDINQISLYILYVLMFLVGITIGNETSIFKQLRGGALKVLLVPAATIIGTLVGVAAVSFFISGRSLTECLMVGSGMGYYSLSSVLITQSHSAALGTVSLISNVLRELITLVCAPILVAIFSPLAPICSGGATTIDTTLPIITRFSGKEFVFIAIVNGVVVDFSVPLLVTFFSSIS